MNGLAVPITSACAAEAEGVPALAMEMGALVVEVVVVVVVVVLLEGVVEAAAVVLW